jgi:hypothetical protein
MPWIIFNVAVKAPALICIPSRALASFHFVVNLAKVERYVIQGVRRVEFDRAIRWREWSFRHSAAQ